MGNPKFKALGKKSFRQQLLTSILYYNAISWVTAIVVFSRHNGFGFSVEEFVLFR